jgi:Predicted methyltransferase (contains TPR repeat)
MSIKPFSEIAEYYDLLFEDVDYERWARYVVRFFSVARVKVERVLEVGCGTGNLTKHLKDMGFRVVGLDSSEEMVRVARRKLPEVEFFVADVRDFSLNEEFDAVVSTFDSLNNILDDEGLVRAFLNVRRHLRDGGVFVFDLNTPHAMQTIWNEAVFVKVLRNGIYSIWRGEYLGNAKSKLNLTLFVPYGENLYRKIEEIYIERGYSPSQVKVFLTKAGFTGVYSFDDLTTEKPTSKSTRVTYVAI